jgi:hypothetical protein
VGVVIEGKKCAHAKVVEQKLSLKSVFSEHRPKIFPYFNFDPPFVEANILAPIVLGQFEEPYTQKIFRLKMGKDSFVQ